MKILVLCGNRKQCQHYWEEKKDELRKLINSEIEYSVKSSQQLRIWYGNDEYLFATPDDNFRGLRFEKIIEMGTVYEHPKYCKELIYSIAEHLK